MKSAFGRLSVIALITILWAVLALFGLRQLGFGQKFSAMDHPLLKPKFVIAAEAGGAAEAPANSLVAFRQSRRLSDQVLLEADLRRTKDGHWVLMQSDFLDLQTDGSGRMTQKTLAELKALDLGYKFSPDPATGPQTFPYRGKGLKVLTINEFLDEFSSGPLILDVHTKYVDQVKELMVILKTYNLDNSLIFNSDHPGVIKKAKSEKPRWLFAADSPSVAQARVMSALFIETMSNIKGDVVIAPTQSRRQPSLTRRLAKEIKRRQKKILIQVDSMTELNNSWASQYADGIMTKRPTQVYKQLTQ